MLCFSECDVPVPGIVHFFGGIGTGMGKIGTGKKSQNRYRKNVVPKKVLEPVLEKFGTGKKSRNRYRQIFGTEKSLGTGLVEIWSLSQDFVV